MTEKPHNSSGRKREYTIELLPMDVAEPLNEGFDGSRYWLTIVDDSTGWIEVIPHATTTGILSSSHYASSSTITSAWNRNVDQYDLTGIPEQVGEQNGVDQHQQTGVAETAHRTLHD
jgi:hypothetical protein